MLLLSLKNNDKSLFCHHLSRVCFLIKYARKTGITIVHFESLETFLKEVNKIGSSIKVYTLIRPISRIDAYAFFPNGLALHLCYECESERELDSVIKNAFKDFHGVPKVEML